MVVIAKNISILFNILHVVLSMETTNTKTFFSSSPKDTASPKRIGMGKQVFTHMLGISMLCGTFSVIVPSYLCTYSFILIASDLTCNV